MLLYRGTQTPNYLRTARGLPSYTPSLPVAVIYSAVPGAGIFHSGPQEAHFIKGSTVTAVEFKFKKVLDLRGDESGNYCSLADVIDALGFGRGGINVDEVRKIYNYLHNRNTGKAKGGEFSYKFYDEDRETELDERDLLSLHDIVFGRNSIFLWPAREEFEHDPTLEQAARLVADAFIFADSPAVRRVAAAQGFDAILYEDVCTGCGYAAEDLFEVTDLESIGIDEGWDIEMKDVPVHETYRPLIDGRVVWQKPGAELVGDIMGIGHMKKKQATGITVYHGSSSGGIVDLESNQPPEGGIGYGIYVTDDFETAKFYGNVVYELRLMLDPDKDILYVGYEFDNADAVAGTEGSSVLIGEHVEPFSFWIRDQRYTVGFDDTPGVAESEYIKEHVSDVEFPDPIRDGLNKYFATIKRRGDAANLEDFIDELGEYVDLDEMNALYPGRDFIDNDEDYKLLQDRVGALLEPVTDRAREIVEKYIGLVIDLMDIGQEAEAHGYRAVKMEGVRGGFPDTEILVFDPKYLVMIGEVKP